MTCGERSNGDQHEYRVRWRSGMSEGNRSVQVWSMLTCGAETEKMTDELCLQG